MTRCVRTRTRPSPIDALFAHDVLPAHYLLYLTRLYGYVAPVECALEMTPGLERVIDLARARQGEVHRE